MREQESMDLLDGWERHNKRHACYYEDADDAGMGLCPSEYATLGDYLEAYEFPVETLKGQFYGHDLDEPNFRSRNSGQEKPVENEEYPSIAEMRRRGVMRVDRSIYRQGDTEDTQAEGSEKSAEAPSENEQVPWEVEAMNYFKERLDEIHESTVRAFSGVMAEQSRLHTRIDALVEVVSKVIDERSAQRVVVQPKVVVTVENVPADVAEELQAGLDAPSQAYPST